MAYNIYETPQEDYLFKKIFASKGNEDMLAEMLEEILEIKINKIKITEESILKKAYKDTKEGRIDLKVEVDDKKVIDVEVQIKNNENMVDRTIYYASALQHETLERGGEYASGKEVIVISILSYNIFQDEKYIVSGRYRRDDTKEAISDKIKLYYIQLPKFLEQKNTDKKKLAQWLYFISQKNKEELKMAIEENDKVARAEKLLEEALADPETREILRIKEKIRFDKRMDIEGAEKRGEKESQKKIAQKLKERGMPIEEIVDITGLDKKELEEL